MFEGRYTVNPETGCHEWAGSRHPKGYGTVKRKGRVEYAHRVAYAERHGPIPPGLEVCHTCDNPPCILDEHHFLGTHAENMADMAAKGRGARSRPGHGAKKLTWAKVDAIRADPRLHREIASEYGVSRVLVTNIKSGKKWRKEPANEDQRQRP